MDPKVTQEICADIAEGLNLTIQILNFLHTAQTPATTATPTVAKE